MAKRLIIIISVVIFCVDSARILAVFPTPSISHQVVFRPVVHELVNRGHEVVLVTTDPVFPNGGGPVNLTEIDLHDIAYKPWADYLPEEYKETLKPGITFSMKKTSEMFTIMFTKVMEEQFSSEPIKKLISDKTQHFDLIFVEAFARPALVFSYIFKAPVIQFSSLGTVPFNLDTFGITMHPILHPYSFSRKFLNLNVYERFMEFYNLAICQYVTYTHEKEENEMLRRTVGPGIPTITELARNVDMLFLNIHPIWEFNRPVPPNIIHLGALHIKPEKDLPKYLKTYLDSSKNGVIYVSFGTNVDPSMFPPGTVEQFVKVFAELPYDILWKWHTKDLPGLSKNVKMSKWLPQRDLLVHANVKLFITQGGLQSTDETILAGVPVVCLPMIGDQWYNAEMYVKHGIGLRLDIDTFTPEKFKNAVETVINNKSYKENIIKLRKLMYDQPETPLERAVWWTEHVLRHGGARHLRSPAANLPWSQYYEIELVTYLLTGLIALFVVSVFLVYVLLKYVTNLFLRKDKLKRNKKD